MYSVGKTIPYGRSTYSFQRIALGLAIVQSSIYTVCNIDIGEMENIGNSTLQSACNTHNLIKMETFRYTCTG